MTLERIRDVLGWPTRMTAFRKLAALNYRGSYSHGGRYYTLNEIAEYDALGLWSFDEVHFSERGSLLDSIEHLVNSSLEGCFARELQVLLHVRVHNPLARVPRGRSPPRLNGMSGIVFGICMGNAGTTAR